MHVLDWLSPESHGKLGGGWREIGALGCCWWECGGCCCIGETALQFLRELHTRLRDLELQDIVSCLVWVLGTSPESFGSKCSQLQSRHISPMILELSASRVARNKWLCFVCILVFLSLDALPVVCLCIHVHAWYPWRPEEGIRSPGTGVRMVGSCCVGAGA